MKLIDLLVQELPKRGGWPEGAENAVQDKDDTEIYFFSGNSPHLAGSSWWGAGAWIFTDWENDLSDDWDSSIVSREQYESALAASQQPVWGSELLLPTGFECEWHKHTHDAIPAWREGVIKYFSDCTVVIKTDDPGEIVGHPCNFYFRPVRTESERKREESIDAIANLCHRGDPEDDATGIYDAIAAGEIPGIRLE